MGAANRRGRTNRSGPVRRPAASGPGTERPPGPGDRPIPIPIRTEPPASVRRPGTTRPSGPRKRSSVPSDVLSPPALTSAIVPRSDLLIPSHVVERRDATGRVAQRGVLGTLDVRGTDSGHVLRHQRIAEEEVERQSRLLSARRDAGDEPSPASDPLLLAAPDLGTFRECIELTSAGAPDAVLPTPDAGEVLLWSCDRRWSAAPPPLGPVLLADGHHRLEAARRMGRARGRAPERLPALVVDHRNHPLTLAATHRVIPGLDPHRAVGT
ncbi:DUF1015 family protein, partial [Streptomyces alkaliphilus]|nr:DUF1015 family protein [Streptomyces alkaliphilus]